MALVPTSVILESAVKDIVEAAQKLARLFTGVSNNLRNAQSLTSEIAQTVDQLKDFCDQYSAAFDSSLDMKNALLSLNKDINVVYARCFDLMRAPVTDGRVRKVKIVALGTRRNNSKIESDLLELRNRVNKCHTQFLVFTAMSAHTAQGTGMIEGVSDDSIIAFVGTNSRILATIPREIDYFISDTYLRLQIDAIDDYLVQLSSASSYPVEEPLEAYMLPYQPVMVSSSTQDNISLRQDVISKIEAIQEVLRDDSSTLSIQTGAWDMVNLCIGLFSLEMYQEAATMGLWTVNLFRTLVRANSEIYSPYLAHSLRQLTRFYTEINDYDAAQRTIRECITISKRLNKTSKDLELRVQIVSVLTMAAFVDSRKGSTGTALVHSEEAVRIFESLIEENRASHGESDIQLIRTESDWASALLSFSDKAVCDYSRALQQLSYILQDEGRLAESIQAQLKATTVMNFISQYYPDGTLESELGDMYFRLSHQEFHDVVPLDEALGYSQRAVKIYRSLTEKSPSRYGKSLCNALWEQANILGKLLRYDEALVVWKETAELARDIVADMLYHANALEQVSWNLRRLKRHDEAAMTRTESAKVYQSVHKDSSIGEADAYYASAVDLQLAERYLDAVVAAEMAVTQYRALAFKDASKYTKSIAKGLNLLTGILLHANRHDQAFNEGHEALKLYKSLIDDDPEVLPDYIRALNLNSFLAIVSNKQEKSIERSEHVISHSRELSARFPETPAEDSVLVRAIINHSRVLTNCARLPAAAVTIQEALDWYDENPAKGPKQVFQHIDCLIEIGSLLDNQGYTEKALVPIEKSIDIGKPFSHDPAVASLVLGSMHRRAQLFLEMGRYSEGVVASEEGITFARATTLENMAEFIGCLQVASVAYKYAGEPEKAIVAINEALELCRSDALAELAKTRVLLLLQLPQCLEFLSSSLAAAGREDEALPVAQDAVDESLKLKSKLASLPWSDIEPTYMGTIFNISARLAANDDLPRALELVVQARKYYDERSQTRNGVFTTLACILRAEGFFYCASGQHEHGIAAKTKLSDLMTRLEGQFPSLARLVEIELDGDRGLSSWIALVAKLNLQCHHQDEDRTPSKVD